MGTQELHRPNHRNAQPQSPAHSGLTTPQLNQAKRLILSNLNGPLGIVDIAAQCNLTRSHFSRAFKLKTGLSPQEWRLHARMEKAKALLGTERPLIDIGLECGFWDQSHFTRMFSRLIGQTPRAWRRAASSHVH